MPAEKPSEAAIRDWCIAYLTRTLDRPNLEIDASVPFSRLGLDSATSVWFIVALEEWLGVELTPDIVFEYPTIADLAQHLATC